MRSLRLLELLLFLLSVFGYDDRFDTINPSVNISKINSYIAVCAVVKNERTDDLLEWIDYHYRMGISKFYLHNNGEIPIEAVLLHYIEKNIVVVKEVKEIAPQLRVYHRCLRNHRQFHRWIAFIDADEFIVTRNNCSIPSILKKYEGYGGLTLQWRLFGSSGHILRPIGGILANYWTCSDADHVKTIANTEYAVSHHGNPHLCHYSHGKYSIDTDYWKVSSPNNTPRPSLYQMIYLNHYHLKSKEDFERSVKRGRASTTAPGKKQSPNYFKDVNALCKKNCSILEMPKSFARDCPLSMFHDIQPPSFE